MKAQNTSRQVGPCLVCGGVATGINFTVATCAPCKAFFRRNAVKLGVCLFFFYFLFFFMILFLEN
jgi:hypothetical protein